ncbi:MAG TPA: hypothetical protein VFZ78_12300, partial [Flavisolibacter sp.]
NPKGNVRFNGSLGFQKDNLKEQKASTTNRFIGSGNLSWDISKVFGLDANYLNFSANATPQVTMVNNKYLLAQTTHNMSLTPRLVLPGENLTHVLVGGYNLSTLVDNNADTKAFNEVTTAVSFLNYNLTFNHLALTVTTGGNYTQNEFSGMEQTLYGGTLGLARSLLGSKLQLSATGSYSKSDQPAGATIINGNFSAMYAVAKRHRFSLRYYMINNNPDDPALSAKFTEHTGELGYSISF